MRHGCRRIGPFSLLLLHRGMQVTALGMPALLERVSKAHLAIHNLFCQFDLNADGVVGQVRWGRCGWAGAAGGRGCRTGGMQLAPCCWSPVLHFGCFTCVALRLLHYLCASMVSRAARVAPCVPYFSLSSVIRLNILAVWVMQDEFRRVYRQLFLDESDERLDKVPCSGWRPGGTTAGIGGEPGVPQLQGKSSLGGWVGGDGPCWQEELAGHATACPVAC